MKMAKAIGVCMFGGATLALGMGLAGVPGAAGPGDSYRDGTVWNIAYIKVKPGMNDADLEYLAGQWKSLQDGYKKEGLILSYKVITTESHGPTDFNVMLMTEYKDLATMEASEDKFEALAAKLVGDDQKQRQGYVEREEIREVLANRLAREIVLSPKGN